MDADPLNPELGEHFDLPERDYASEPAYLVSLLEQISGHLPDDPADLAELTGQDTEELAELYGHLAWVLAENGLLDQSPDEDEDEDEDDEVEDED